MPPHSFLPHIHTYTFPFHNLPSCLWTCGSNSWPELEHHSFYPWLVLNKRTSIFSLHKRARFPTAVTATLVAKCTNNTEARSKARNRRGRGHVKLLPPLVRFPSQDWCKQRSREGTHICNSDKHARTHTPNTLTVVRAHWAQPVPKYLKQPHPRWI